MGRGATGPISGYATGAARGARPPFETTAAPKNAARRRAPGGRGISLAGLFRRAPRTTAIRRHFPSVHHISTTNHMTSKHSSSAMKTNTSTIATRASNRTASAAAARVTRRAAGWPYCLQPGRPNYAFGPLNNSELPFYVHLPRPANRAASFSCEQRLNAAPPS